jgi:hypothetical protein
VTRFLNFHCLCLASSGECAPASEVPVDGGDEKRSGPLDSVPGLSLTVSAQPARPPPTADPPPSEPFRHQIIAIPEGPYKLWWKFFLFLRAWTLIFHISTRASAMLYKILSLMLPPMLGKPPKITNYIVDKTLGIDSKQDTFIGYVCCKNCHKLHQLHDSYTYPRGATEVSSKNTVTKYCDGTLLQNHRLVKHRICGAPLLRIARALDGEQRDLVPYLTYAYRPVQDRLFELLNRPGFEDLCERWRHRDVPDGHFGDIMDGSVWRDFGSVLHYDDDGKPVHDKHHQQERLPFLDVAGNYALSIFVDWFQPWRRVQYSVGVLCACILNLPREERHKKENIFLIGIFPGGTEKNLSLNPLLEPFKDEMLKLHPKRGVTMSTHKFPKGRKVHAVCMLAVCDLPAAKKVSGFVGHNGDRGCSRCDKLWSSEIVAIKETAKVDGEASTDDEESDDEDEKKGEGKEEKRDDPGDSDDTLEGKSYARQTVPKRKSARTWRRVYAKPAAMGTPRELANHRVQAKAWLTARTKTEQAKIAKSTGVKYSVLLQLDYWNPIQFTVIDSLHAFWLGICRSLLTLWRDTKWKPRDLDEMQRRLNSLVVPSDTCRILNKWASNMSYLTGHQIKAFVGCFSLPVLDGYLNQKEKKLWRHLVTASRYLSQHALSSVEIDHVPVTTSCHNARVTALPCHSHSVVTRRCV